MNRILIALTFMTSTAYAGNITLSWKLPTGREQCTNVTETPVIASTEIWQLVTRGGPTDTETILTGLEPGKYEYIASVTDTDGNVSRVTTPSLMKTVTDLKVSDNKAYTVVQSGGKLVAFIIGTVPVGTVCNVGSMVRGEFNFQPFTGYSVPVADVTITGDTEPVMIVARCL
jgi:hypothetical protein